MSSPWRRRGAAVAAAAAVVVGLLPSAALAAPESPAGPAASDLDPFDAVNQFIGTELDTTQNKSNDAYGNTFPGAAMPFGMVQSSPTTYRPNVDALIGEKGGYEYTARLIRGFGMTRYSGSGCTGRYGGYEFPTIPFSGDLPGGVLPVSPAANIRNYYLAFDHANETDDPGYYGVRLDNGIGVELTATERTAVSTFAFPEGANSTLILDASGPNNRTFGSEVTIDPATRTVSGWMYGVDVCDNGNNYRAYFSTTYDQPFESFGTWTDDAMTAGSAHVVKSTDNTGADYRHDTGAWITFAGGAEVTARTGFSYVSVENAAENRVAEADGKSFDQVRTEAGNAWREALGTVAVTGGTDEERTKFYTSVYHSFLHPNLRDDVDGSYLGYDDQVHAVEPGRHFYKNFAGSGWDMYRSQGQLIALSFPQVASDINQSIVALTEQTGSWAPGAARMQGDNLQVILATLDDMGATDYDRAAALESMITTQVLPATTSKRTDAYQYFATGFLENRKGDFATSRVLEYSIDDFAIAHFARSLGDEESYDLFIARAQNWMNVFDPVTQHIRPRERTGFDRNFDLRVREDGAGRGQFNQSTGYQYGWLVPHNLATLIEKRGGIEPSMRALDVLMAQLDAGAYTQTGNYLSNQPAFSSPYVYNWLRAPHKTVDVLYRAVEEMYDTSPTGLPGNDDQGALSAWYVFATLGITPTIYGTGDLVVSAPMWDRIVIDPVGSDRVITIDAPGVSTGEKYVAGLSVDGVAQTASWVDASFVRDGGTLSFDMAAAPTAWGTGAADVPPSYTDGADVRNNIGISPNTQGRLASLDLSDNSLSRERLAAAGAAPGAQLPLGDTGVVFTWPDTEPGQPDNWIPHGQRVDLPDAKAGGISFLGLATNGPSQGMATVEYTDGTTQQVMVQLTDWSAGSPAFGNTPLVQTVGRNNVGGGSDQTQAKVFASSPSALDASKTVTAVRLPESSDQGVMHIFAVGTARADYTDPNAPTGEPDRVVLNPAADPAREQTVTWRSRSAQRLDGVLELRPAAGGTVRTVDAAEGPERFIDGYPARSHTVTVDDLKPSTAYVYRVRSGKAWTEWAEFTTAAAAAEPFSFLYFGDAQEGIDTVFTDTVRQAHLAVPDAAVSLYAGDLVNTSSNQNEWRQWFAAVEPLRTTANVLTTAGNHEFAGDVQLNTFRDAFQYPANGPVPSDAGAKESPYGVHMAQAMADSVYYTDYQGVRFITVNANRGDACELMRPLGLPGYNCGDAQRTWMAMQASWLNRILAENPNRWSVVLAHQPIFSTGIADGAQRDEADWRRFIQPVLERNNVDLVLQGHDHTYGRGHHSRNASSKDGLSTGPVYVVANAGQKQYALPGADDNTWTRNNGVAVVRAQDTTTYQAITVDGDTLRYRSVATWVRPGGAATVAPGETLDSFSITKYDTGAKWVAEDGVEVPDASVPSESRPRPSDDVFDPATFGDVVWDDDFTTDRLAEYDVSASVSEGLPQLAVDPARGVLTATATGRAWGHVAVPVEAGEKVAVIVEPEAFAATGRAEDSLFIGASDGPRNFALSWYNQTKALGGVNVSVNGQGKGNAEGQGEVPVRWESGDRMATVIHNGELTSWIEKDGVWTRINQALAGLAVDEDALTGWAPTFSLRLDPGTIAIDRVTVLRGSLPGACPAPDKRATVVVGDIVTKVPNAALPDGCTINDLILDEQEWPSNAAFVRHVGEVLDRPDVAAVINVRQRRDIVRAALDSSIG